MGFLYSTDRTRHDLNQNTSGHGKYIVREQDDLQAKYAQFARKLKSFELKKIYEVSTSSSSNKICVICDKRGILLLDALRYQNLRKYYKMESKF